jgi:hypothetical protein
VLHRSREYTAPDRPREQQATHRCREGRGGRLGGARAPRVLVLRGGRTLASSGRSRPAQRAAAISRRHPLGGTKRRRGGRNPQPLRRPTRDGTHTHARWRGRPAAPTGPASLQFMRLIARGRGRQPPTTTTHHHDHLATAGPPRQRQPQPRPPTVATPSPPTESRRPGPAASRHTHHTGPGRAAGITAPSAPVGTGGGRRGGGQR